MRFLESLFDKNKRWAQKITANDPEFFKKTFAAAIAGIFVDRLFGQPRSRK